MTVRYSVRQHPRAKLGVEYTYDVLKDGEKIGMFQHSLRGDDLSLKIAAGLWQAIDLTLPDFLGGVGNDISPRGSRLIEAWEKVNSMKTLGLIGGMSWESTATYYRLLNEGVREKLGGLHSAKLLLWSVDFAEIAVRQHANDWAGAAALMVDAAKRLEGAGAEAVMICTNTMHICADAVEAAVKIPLIHIADATAEALVAAGCKRPALLATRFTMEEDFYKGRLENKFGLDCLVPDADGRDIVHRIIYEELCKGVVRVGSKVLYLKEIARLEAEGADSVILGCTEIGMLIGQKDIALPVFDTTLLHAEAGLLSILE